MSALTPNAHCNAIEICLEVPNLGQAASFYTALFDALPAASERRMVWIDIPDSRLRIELREAMTPTTTRLRLCTEPHQLKLVTERLRRGGIVIAQAGLTTGESPRSITFRDPGHNSWELYTPISTARARRPIREITSRVRHLSQLAQAAVAEAAALEARFDRERQHHQAPDRCA